MKKQAKKTEKRRKSRTGFSYFWSEGLHNIFLHGFMSFAAVSIILCCLLITGSVALISYNIDLNITDLEKKSEIVLFIDESFSAEQARAVEQKLLAIDNIASAEFQPRDEALENYRDTLGDDAVMLDGFDSSNNPLRDGYRVTLEDLSLVHDTVERLRAVNGVVNISDNQDTLAKLVKVQQVFRLISFALIAALGAISIFIISNTVKLAMFTRREEIAIEKMVGATNWFIRWPFVIEGLILGLVAGGLATLAEWGVYTKLIDAVGVIESFQMAQFSDFKFVLLAVFLTAGVVIGVGGSVLSMRRFLDV